MKAKIILSVAVILVVAAALVWKTKKGEPEPQAASSVQQTGVMITASGFEPGELKIKKGTAVTFYNQDTKSRWPASAPHPTHTDYPEFDPKQPLPLGQSWSFTFEKTGTWKYHDHLNPTYRGTIIIE